MDKFELLRQAESLDLSEFKSFASLINAMLASKEDAAHRLSVVQKSAEQSDDRENYREWISVHTAMKNNVILAIAELASHPDDMFRSGEINEVINQRLGRYVNVSNAAGDAEKDGFVRSKRISPRRESYGLTAMGWQYVQSYTKRMGVLTRDRHD